VELNRGEAGYAKRYRVIGNTISAPVEMGNRYGITIANNIQGTVVEGNTTHNMTIGIWMVNAPVLNTHVIGNINRVAPGGVPWGGGTSTYAVHNY
jgi:hypothetical protein